MKNKIMKDLFDFDMNWYRDGFITIIELFTFLIINITSLILFIVLFPVLFFKPVQQILIKSLENINDFWIKCNK